MSQHSKIEWTDATWNPVRGCTRVSPGCGGPGKEGGCYAEKIAARFSDPGQPFHGFAKRTPHGGQWTGKLALIDDMLTVPLRWKKPRRIFVNSMSDLFHEKLPDEAIDKVFAVMALCPQHTFQVLTKRAERMREYLTNQDLEDRLTELWQEGDPDKQSWNLRLPLPNVWLGVSVERQQEADERRAALRAVAAQGWTTFVSYEPALGPVDWTGWEFVKQLISGGESGPRARPSHPDWHRAGRDWSAENDVAFFFKQWGEWRPSGGWIDGQLEHGTHGVSLTGKVARAGDLMCGNVTGKEWAGYGIIRRVGKKAAGRLLDGKEHNAFPHGDTP